MSKNLFNTIWDQHTVRKLPTGQDQIFIGLHLIHEVTSPQAFQMLRDRKLSVLYPKQTFATIDHIVPTEQQKQRPYRDRQAEEMARAIEKNTADFGITFFSINSSRQGIVHVIGPELGLTQPGMTIACGDSHTSTHGAFGAIAMGIGTSQVRDVLASQCLALNRPKVRKIEIKGIPPKGIYAKDIILKIIADLTVKGGIGYAYEYSGQTIEYLSMEARMTICNMSIEGGARMGYINPDEKTFAYLQEKEYAPKNDAFERAKKYWLSIASKKDAQYDDITSIDIQDLAPRLTWGIHPGQGISIEETIPPPHAFAPQEQNAVEHALAHMRFKSGETLQGKKIDVAFIGSCTNGRLSDLREAAKILKGNKISSSVRSIVVPGSQDIARQAQKEGIADIFRQSGFQWREAGCSMCLAMNPDKLEGHQLCASTSNRNFIGRQGSPEGRTILMSPAMVAAAALAGEIVDVRKYGGSNYEWK